MIKYLLSIYYWHHEVFESMIVSLVISCSIAAFILAIGIIWMHKKGMATKKRIAILSCSCVYTMLLYMITFGCRIPNEEIRVSVEFKHYFDLENILLFIPLGMLLATRQKSSVKSVLVISVALSIIIELCQLFTRLGFFEIMDILHNAVGAIVGYAVVLVFKWLHNRWIQL